MRKIIIPFCVLLLASCYSDKEDQLYPKPVAGTGCDTANVTYTVHIKPIMDQYCAISGCHDNVTKSFTHNLSNYAGTKSSAERGRFLPSITQEPNYLPMPKGMAKLNDCEISQITAWINAGMPE